MFLAVWLLYAGDRLLDAYPLGRHPIAAADLELRHLFHHRHRRPFLAGILLASLGLAGLLPHLAPAAIHLYLTLGSLLLGYFILIHTAAGVRLPKEIAVGLFFSAAIFIPTVARRSSPPADLRPTLLPLALLFAALCCLNCLCIYAWEHRSAAAASHAPHLLTRIATRRRRPLACTLILLALAVVAIPPHPFAGIAVALSSFLLLLLDLRHARISALTLRATADLSLATPLLFLPYLLPHR